MKLIGQFNNAFIISCLGSNLFMIDQHAADEKYNFEMLQNCCKIKSQKLFKAQLIKFGPLDYALLKDNLELFNRNGFEFSFDNDIGDECEEGGNYGM
jgi:DNA mismatch repair protein PMS2